MLSGLSCCKCYASDEAGHLLKEIDIPVFRTNTLILECAQQTTMVSLLHELQGLARISPQGTSATDELWRNMTEMRDENCLHFH